MRFLWLILVLCACSRTQAPIRIGVDSHWGAFDFGQETPYVNGFIGEVLGEISKQSGRPIEKIDASSDSLLAGLKSGRFDAILTQPPGFGEVFETSPVLVELGAILIVNKAGKWKSLEGLKGELVGVIEGDPCEQIVGRQGDLVIRRYVGIPELLNAVVLGEIEGAVVNRLPAINYVADLYAPVLKVVGKPMSQSGIYLISKDAVFPSEIAALKSKRHWDELLRKWRL
jgi:polar amino acid transport system substrate-binding protein